MLSSSPLAHQEEHQQQLESHFEEQHLLHWKQMQQIENSDSDSVKTLICQKSKTLNATVLSLKKKHTLTWWWRFLNREAKLNLELYSKKSTKKFRSQKNENDVLIILRCSREDGEEGRDYLAGKMRRRLCASQPSKWVQRRSKMRFYIRVLNPTFCLELHFSPFYGPSV